MLKEMQSGSASNSANNSAVTLDTSPNSAFTKVKPTGGSGDGQLTRGGFSTSTMATPPTSMLSQMSLSGSEPKTTPAKIMTPFVPSVVERTPGRGRPPSSTHSTSSRPSLEGIEDKELNKLINEQQAKLKSMNAELQEARVRAGLPPQTSVSTVPPLPAAFMPPSVERHHPGDTPKLTKLSPTFDLQLDAPDVRPLQVSGDLVMTHKQIANTDAVNTKLASKGFTPTATEETVVRRKIKKPTPATTTTTVTTNNNVVVSPMPTAAAFVPPPISTTNDVAAKEAAQRITKLENRLSVFEKNVDDQLKQLNNNVMAALTKMQDEMTSVKLNRQELLARDQRMTEAVIEKVAKTSLSQLNTVMSEGLQEFFEQVRTEVDALETSVQQSVNGLQMMYQQVSTQVLELQAKLDVYQKQLDMNAETQKMSDLQIQQILHLQKQVAAQFVH